MELRAHQAVKLKAGKYAGAVGYVLAVDQETGKALVKVAGIFDGEPVDFEREYAPDSLEVVG